MAVDGLVGKVLEGPRVPVHAKHDRQHLRIGGEDRLLLHPPQKPLEDCAQHVVGRLHIGDATAEDVMPPVVLAIRRGERPGVEPPQEVVEARHHAQLLHHLTEIPQLESALGPAGHDHVLRVPQILALSVEDSDHPRLVLEVVAQHVAEGPVLLGWVGGVDVDRLDGHPSHCLR